MKTLSLLKRELGKPYHDLEFILNILKEVLMENKEMELAKAIPWVNDHTEIPAAEFSAKHIHLYSVVFQLLNIVEINGAVQSRRQKETESLSSVKGLWAEALQELKKHGVSETEIAVALSDVRVEPVLTAHPTEAKRDVVLYLNRKIYLLVVKRENQMYTRQEQNDIRNEIKVALHHLWRMGEINVEKPDVDSELKNMIYYLTDIFPEVLKIHDRRLAHAWEDVGFNSSFLRTWDTFPRITFGNWVGGDRDGHPLVTADVTRSTLNQLRLNSFVIIRRDLSELVKLLSFPVELSHTERTLQIRISELLNELGDVGQQVMDRYKGETYRQYVGLLLSKLPIDVRRDHIMELHEEPYSYRRSIELIADLKILQNALVQHGADTIAYADLNHSLRLVQTFGFHLAHLDIRQNSKFHENAVAQLMNAAALNGNDYLKWDEKKRLEFLNHELESNRPFTHPSMKLDYEAQAVTSCYAVVEKHISKYGHRAFGALIVSMTRNVSDLVAVYVLAREAGLTVQTSDGIACLLPVVPLFETIEDLQSSHEILDKFLSHPFTRRSLEYQRKLDRANQLVQQVMIGYSDSNKDGGILASLWNLYHAQARMTEVGEKHGLKIRFFHGKGGSISRGAGPTQWFLRALPHSSIKGDLRQTEQGETIAQKYANKVNAAYNMELLIAGTAFQTLINKFTDYKAHPLQNILLQMAAESEKTYRELTHNQHFISFFTQATPIDAIEQSKIGSRPSRRTGKRSLEDLRAIPWVFSWSQSRFNITSWYGVGTTLENLHNNRPDEFDQLKKAVKTDTFIRYIMTNIDTSLAATDERIMTMYASLVHDEKAYKVILGLMLNELSKTRRMVDLLLARSLKERRANHYYSNLLRAEALDRLHASQVYLLSKWRTEQQNGHTAEADQTLLNLLRSINGIASALRTTG